MGAAYFLELQRNSPRVILKRQMLKAETQTKPPSVSTGRVILEGCVCRV